MAPWFLVDFQAPDLEKEAAAAMTEAIDAMAVFGIRGIRINKESMSLGGAQLHCIYNTYMYVHISIYIVMCIYI